LLNILAVFLTYSQLFASGIVSLDPSTTELLFAVGLGKEIVARDAASNYPAAVKSKTIIAHHLRVDREKLIQLKPDVIVSLDYQYQGLDKRIQHIKLQNRKLEDLTKNIALLKKHFPQIAMVTPSQINKQPKLVGKSFILYADKDQRIAVGKDSFISEALEKCGLKNKIRQKGYPKLSRESLSQMQADFNWVLGHKKQDLNADIYSRLTPRFMRAIQQLCESLAQE
tara:strand:+ start:6164 stop:6841 length:678 start_codon:yes stop_codon:yes gene_type:complete